MCRLTECCCYLPLRAGCILASLIEFGVAIIEVLVYVKYTLQNQEDQKALCLLELCTILMCSVLLFIGATMEERVCVISHAVFLIMGLTAEIVLQAVVFKLTFLANAPDWMVAYSITYHCLLVYMIPVSISYAIELRDVLHGEGGFSFRHHRQISSVMSSEIYGM